MKFDKVCIVGSTRFMGEMLEDARELTLYGAIVLMPLVVTSEQVTETDPKIKAMLTLMHFEKIDMADQVWVTNPNGYIGDSTAAEIMYAEKLGKQVKYRNDPESKPIF